MFAGFILLQIRWGFPGFIYIFFSQTISLLVCSTISLLVCVRKKRGYIGVYDDENERRAWDSPNFREHARDPHVWKIFPYR